MASLAKPVFKTFYPTYPSFHKSGSCTACEYFAFSLDYPIEVEIGESQEKLFPAKFWWVAPWIALLAKKWFDWFYLWQNDELQSIAEGETMEGLELLAPPPSCRVREFKTVSLRHKFLSFSKEQQRPGCRHANTCKVKMDTLPGLTIACLPRTACQPCMHVGLAPRQMFPGA